MIEFSQEPIRYSQSGPLEKEFFMQKPRPFFEKPRNYWKREHHRREQSARE